MLCFLQGGGDDGQLLARVRRSRAGMGGWGGG